MKSVLARLMKPKKIIIKNLNKRAVGLLAFILAVGFGFSFYGLLYAQIIKGEFFRKMAETQQLSDTAITANRGIIYDRNMTVLAQSASAWKISMNATNFANAPKDVQESVFKELEDVLGLSREYLEKKASYKNLSSISIKTKVEKEEKDKLSEFISQTYKGTDGKKTSYSTLIMIDEDVKRYYPYSTLAAQVLGFTGTDNDGLSGLEAYYNSLLTGVDGRVIAARSNSSIAQDVEYKSIHEAQQGTSLVLTIDETIQRYLENALSDCFKTSGCKSCYGIVMDVKTGGILAMSTQMGFDANEPYKIHNESVKKYLDGIEDESEKDKETVNAQYEQWRNTAISNWYEPGSVYKVVTMAAGLEENAVKYDEVFNCDGNITVDGQLYYCHDHSGHGPETLTEGLMNSCNPYFITIGQRLGIDTFYKYFEAFGFTEKTGIDMLGESAPTKGPGLIQFRKEDMTRINLASSSFGQSFQVTGIQMLNAINAVANGGKLMTPYVVAKHLDSNGNVIAKKSPVVKRQVISESTAKLILASMEEVSRGGTAKNSYVSGFHVAGKTGTSDKLNNIGQYIASFAGCAPSYNPEISIIIVVDEPQGATGGGAVAAPVAAEVIEQTLTYLNIERQYNDSEKELLDIQVPNGKGMNVYEAEDKFESTGLNVRVVGDGDTVKSQIPAYGQYIPKNGIVVLYTDDKAEKSKSTVPDFTGLSVSEANEAAVEAGINIKVAGNSMSSSGLTAYRQSIPEKSEIDSGATITVYFRDSAVVDDA